MDGLVNKKFEIMLTGRAKVNKLTRALFINGTAPMVNDRIKNDDKLHL